MHEASVRVSAAFALWLAPSLQLLAWLPSLSPVLHRPSVLANGCTTLNIVVFVGYYCVMADVECLQSS
jgi:hypothetical protein